MTTAATAARDGGGGGGGDGGAQSLARHGDTTKVQPSARALVRTSDAHAMRMRRDMLDAEAPFVPASGSAVERLAALERELRMILGDDVVEEALRLEDAGGDGDACEEDLASSAVAPSLTTMMSSSVLVSVGVEEDVETPELRDVASTSETTVEAPDVVRASTTEDTDEDTPRRTLNVVPTSSSVRIIEVSAPEPGVVEEWDPYSAFMKCGPSRAPKTSPLKHEDKEEKEEEEELTSSAVFTPPKVAKPALMISSDPSLTHDETLRLVAELENRVKSAPKPAPYASPLHQSPGLQRATSTVFVEDITGKDDDGSDDEQRYAHQYTQRDAVAILEQIESESDVTAVTGIWRDVPEQEPAIIAPRSRHGKEVVVDDNDISDNIQVPMISGVESLSDFKLMMSSVFDDDDEDNF